MYYYTVDKYVYHLNSDPKVVLDDDNSNFDDTIDFLDFVGSGEDGDFDCIIWTLFHLSQADAYTCCDKKNYHKTKLSKDLVLMIQCYNLQSSLISGTSLVVKTKNLIVWYKNYFISVKLMLMYAAIRKTLIRLNWAKI